MKKRVNNKSKDYNDNFYSQRYKDDWYVGLRVNDANKLIKQMEEITPFKKNDKVLDLGCGTGEMGAVIKDKFGARVYGIDINSIAVEKARKNGLLAKNADIETKWPYENNFFDSVVSTQMIEHLVNPDLFLQESKRVLNKKGLLIITTPNLAAWFNRIILMFGYQPFFTEVSTIDKTLGLSFTRNLTPIRKPLGHLRCFTLKALKEILEMHGFELVKIKGSPVNYFPWYVSIFDRFFSFFPSLASDLVVVARKK